MLRMRTLTLSEFHVSKLLAPRKCVWHRMGCTVDSDCMYFQQCF